MLDTTALPPQEGDISADAEPAEDTRAPVGKDAGAPQVTADAEADGWHGDAEDDGHHGGAEAGEGQVEKAPVGAQVPEVADIELDADQRRLAEEAMRAVEGVQ